MYDAHMLYMNGVCVYMKFYTVISTIQFKFRTMVCLPSRTSGVLGKSLYHLVTKTREFAFNKPSSHIFDLLYMYIYHHMKQIKYICVCVYI